MEYCPKLTMPLLNWRILSSIDADIDHDLSLTPAGREAMENLKRTLIVLPTPGLIGPSDENNRFEVVGQVLYIGHVNEDKTGTCLSFMIRYDYRKNQLRATIVLTHSSICNIPGKPNSGIATRNASMELCIPVTDAFLHSTVEYDDLVNSMNALTNHINQFIYALACEAETSYGYLSKKVITVPFFKQDGHPYLV